MVNEKVLQAFKNIEAGVKEVYTSDKYKQYLSFITKFHNYSVNNIILILKQYPQASLVAGYKKWQSMNRYVKKGEKGITILAPYKTKIRIEGIDESDKYKIITTGYKTTTVFDISQTQGQEIPSLINDLKGSNETSRSILSIIPRISNTTIIYRNEIDDAILLNGAKGYYDNKNELIVINNDTSNNQKVKTLIHEYAHSILHKHTNKSKEQKEIEAESIAYSVCNYFNIDTSDYSFAYIASYAQKDFTLLKDTLDNIVTVTHSIIDSINHYYNELSNGKIDNRKKDIIIMNYQQNYQQWVDHLSLDDPYYQQLIDIKDDEKEKEDRFYKNLSFGTAGLRGKVGAGTNRMNFYTVGKASQGIANLIKEYGQEAMDKGVVIAHDPRHFSREFCELSASIFASNGIKVYTFPSLRPTPQLAFMIRKLGTTSGINITASHNPKEYNGYKAYWNDGCQVSSQIADAMEEKINAVDIWTGIIKGDYNQLVKEGKIVVLGEKEDREYLDKIEALAIHSGDELDLSIPLVYTPLNGCGSIPFRQMLNDRGFTNWIIVPEQENPDPDFTTVGYPNPEDPKAFALSEKYGREFNAELLMATDPDSDRFAIEIRDNNGNYIPLNGNQTGYLLVNYVLEGHKTAGTLPAKGAMIKSIVTSTLSTKIAKAYNVEMFETLTGFKNICGKIPYLHEHGYRYLFGYEESVGYAACEDIRDKDGISAGMLVAEAAAYYRKSGKTLWDVLQDIYATYGYTNEIGTNIVLEGISGSERIERMMKYIRANKPEYIGQYKVNKVIDYIDGYDDLPPQNALRFFIDDDTWFAIRPSGTEPKIKFYFYANDSSMEKAKAKNNEIKEEILKIINSVQ